MALLGGSALALTGCARPTPQFRGAAGKILPQSIAEETYLPLKGDREFLLVRGRDTSSPAVLFVHGGPGGSETALMRLFNPQLEDHFVMAYWDQRGAGRSFSSDIPRSTMTIAQFLDDMDKIIDHLRARLNKPKVALLCHSWGTALGMLYAHAHPEKISAYAGTGQVASNPEDEMHAYEFVLTQARLRHDNSALEKLKKIGPPPYTYGQLVVRDRLLGEFGGYFHQNIDKWAVIWRALFEVPETDIRDLYRLWRGTAFSQRCLWPAFARLDLTKRVRELKMPVTFILGRYDQRTWSPYAAAYLRNLIAPRKRLIWLEHSAHNGPFEEPAAFRKAVMTAFAGI